MAQPNLLVINDGVLAAEKYSRDLSDHIKRIFNLKPNMNLKDILVKSVELNEQIGKSAALLMKFDNKNKNKLLTTNLGDS